MFHARATPTRSESTSFKVSDTHLYLPSLNLSGCVRAYVTRNTRDIELAAHEMFNHYPASPLCTLMFTFSGEGEVVSRGEEMLRTRVTEPMVVSGPHTVPSVTRNIESVHGMMVFLMPDALQALTGVAITELVNEFRPLRQVLDAEWQHMGQAVLDAADDSSRIAVIESFLIPRWQACVASGQHTTPRLHDWMQGLATRAALSGVGKSTRQLERRVKQWSGQSMQKLRVLARAETSFFEMRDAHEREMLNWAEVAFNTGFSDQAHMCREVKRITGFSPEEVKRSIATEESFWIYRLWA
jgi:AraC-like DNA-binding protein